MALMCKLVSTSLRFTGILKCFATEVYDVNIRDLKECSYGMRYALADAERIDSEVTLKSQQVADSFTHVILDSHSDDEINGKRLWRAIYCKIKKKLRLKQAVFNIPRSYKVI